MQKEQAAVRRIAAAAAVGDLPDEEVGDERVEPHVTRRRPINRGGPTII